MVFGVQAVMRKNKIVRRALGCAEKHEIVGFLYLGTPVTDASPKPKRDVADFFEAWK